MSRMTTLKRTIYNGSESYVLSTTRPMSPEQVRLATAAAEANGEDVETVDASSLGWSIHDYGDVAVIVHGGRIIGTIQHTLSSVTPMHAQHEYTARGVDFEGATTPALGADGTPVQYSTSIASSAAQSAVVFGAFLAGQR